MVRNPLRITLLTAACCLLLTACGPESVEGLELGQSTHAVTVPAKGTSSTLDVAAWNIEWFGSTSNGPTNETLQQSNVRDVIAGTDFDVWGLEEVVSTTAWSNLKAGLPGYAGVLASDSNVTSGASYYSSSEQKVGLLYKTSVASLLSARIILTANDYDFAGRPPLEVKLRTSIGGVTRDIVFIVLHMKAFNDSSSWTRRKNAATALKSYLDTTYPTTRVHVLGDWNDDVDTSITSGYDTPYRNFVSDSADYTFPTAKLSSSKISTTCSYTDTIDHHLDTNDQYAGYVLNSVEVYRVDQYISGYCSNTTDHFPVLLKYNP